MNILQRVRVWWIERKIMRRYRRAKRKAELAWLVDRDGRVRTDKDQRAVLMRAHPRSAAAHAVRVGQLVPDIGSLLDQMEANRRDIEELTGVDMQSLRERQRAVNEVYSKRVAAVWPASPYADLVKRHADNARKIGS